MILQHKGIFILVVCLPLQRVFWFPVFVFIFCFYGEAVVSTGVLNTTSSG